MTDKKRQTRPRSSAGSRPPLPKFSGYVEVEAHYIFHPSTIWVRPLFYGAQLGPKKTQKANFAMKQTNICRLSGDIIITTKQIYLLKSDCRRLTQHVCCYYSCKLGPWTGRTVAHNGLRARRRALHSLSSSIHHHPHHHHQRFYVHLQKTRTTDITVKNSHKNSANKKVFKSILKRVWVCAWRIISGSRNTSLLVFPCESRRGRRAVE